MYQHWQMTLPLLLSVYYRYYPFGIVAVPAVPGYRYPNIRKHPDIRISVVLLHRYGLLRFGGGSQEGSPVGFVGWDPCWDQQS